MELELTKEQVEEVKKATSWLRKIVTFKDNENKTQEMLVREVRIGYHYTDGDNIKLHVEVFGFTIKNDNEYLRAVLPVYCITSTDVSKNKEYNSPIDVINERKNKNK